jgi:hypothetical protein
MKKILTLAVFTLLFFTITTQLKAQLYSFTSQSIPAGVEVDHNNNVLVYHDQLWNNALTKYSSSGRVRGQKKTGGFSSIGQMAKMARLPSSGQILGLYPNGELAVIDPGNLNIRTILRLRSMDRYIGKSRIYDVYRRRYTNMNGTIQPSIAHYGDISVYERGSRLYVFVTGVSAGIPFVMKIEFRSGRYSRADVVASSSATDYNTSEMPRGIAVNRDGTVLTTLPYQPGRRGAYDVAVKFKYNFNSSGRPTYVLNKAPLASWGMATDKDGNFYVTTGPIGSTLSNSRPAIIVLNRYASRVLGGVASSRYLSKSDDIAINPRGTMGYVTDRSNGRTYRFYTRSFTSGNRLETIPTTQELEDIRNDVTAWEEPLTTTPEESPQNDPVEPSTPLTTIIKAFPNPTTDWVTIQLKTEVPQDFVLQLVDGQGRTIWIKEVGQTDWLEESVDMSALSTGMYFLKVRSGKDNQTHIIVKR